MDLSGLAGGSEMIAGAIQAGVGLFGLKRKKKAAEAAFNAIETYKPSQEVADIYQGAKMRSTTGLSGATAQNAKSGINQAAAAAMKASQTKGSALSAAGATQQQLQEGSLKLVQMDEAARYKNISKYAAAAQAQSQEKAKAFQSRQQKQAMTYQKSLSELIAQKQMISQGLTGFAQGLSNVGDKAIGMFTGGMMGGGAKKASSAYIEPDSYTKGIKGEIVTSPLNIQ
jgi:hypothetical protein